MEETSMFRSLLGFAVFAIVAIFALKVIFGLLGLAIGLAMTIAWFALVGFVVYLIIKVVSPGTADRIREIITGKAA
jgi:hypothetical protein